MDKRVIAVWVVIGLVWFLFPIKVNTFSRSIEEIDNNQADIPDVEIEISSRTVHSANISKDILLPNESGKVFIVMFHDFVEEFKPSGPASQAFTMTFQQFRELLKTLYDQNFRLVSLTDFLENKISIPAGMKPIVFTFDDAKPGQFHLVQQGDRLEPNARSAVAIMEAFYEEYPSFGLEGTFYVNMGLSIFNGAGTTKQRLEYLIDRNFEIGNHTYSHANLSKTIDFTEVVYQVGNNQKSVEKLVAGYKMRSLALPFGKSPVRRRYMVSGVYERVRYHNHAILAVGSRPSPPPSTQEFNRFSVTRVRAPGKSPIQSDLYWWLENVHADELFVSDGDIHTLTIPNSRRDRLANNWRQPNNVRIITY